ncbi:MAG: ASKHA domain-containing protein [Acidobacteriota bacterium]|jgi:uncharacterized 2Fe-2S/4Fe-4S cluster protein (DUF4445 family)|nr:ASKHA domain-containing protein [Acidobacteriota bacterium]
MPVVRFSNEKVSVEVPADATLLDAAHKAGVVVDAPCGGAGTCGKCNVRVRWRSAHRARHAVPVHCGEAAVETQTVLACKTLVSAVGGDVTVETLEHSDRAGLKILADGHAFEVAIAPNVTKRFDAAAGCTEVVADGRVLGTEPGDTASEAYGAAVDIGTTTLVVSLVDLSTGEERAVASALNPQARHAQDVLSRIKMGSEPDGLRLLQDEVVGAINELVGQTAAEAGVAAERIYEAVFSGNTTMLHLAAGADPAPLGKFPYTPVLQGGESLRAQSLGLAIAPCGIVYLPPFMSAYVGADITSGILATRLDEQSGVTLFVDIGTNGEMVLAVDSELTATSTAAGPAFEGMNIACGMRAGQGAIEQVALTEDGGVSIKTIGDAKPVGLCGSGLLDAVGELAARGVVEKSGRFRKDETAWQSYMDKLDGKPIFRVADSVYLLQKDIRQVQLAKAAVRVGIELMLAANGVAVEKVDRVLIAGSFGFHLRTDSLINLGLLPSEFRDRVEFVGNTSKTGARAFLLNYGLRDELQDLVKRVRVLELANDPAFERKFVQALSFCI